MLPQEQSEFLPCSKRESLRSVQLPSAFGDSTRPRILQTFWHDFPRLPLRESPTIRSEIRHTNPCLFYLCRLEFAMVGKRRSTPLSLPVRWRFVLHLERFNRLVQILQHRLAVRAFFPGLRVRHQLADVRLLFAH